MSNPRNLQELADVLAEQARTVRAEAKPGAGPYATALLDTRATVLAMITETRCQVCGAPDAREYCPDCGSAQSEDE